MILTTWNTNVNCKFFETKDGIKENVKKTSYLSGRNTAYMANEKFTKTFSGKLSLADTQSNPEYATFVNWYCNQLFGQVNIFTCPALDGKWRFTEAPGIENHPTYKIVTISLEQVL